MQSFHLASRLVKKKQRHYPNHLKEIFRNSMEFNELRFHSLLSYLNLISKINIFHECLVHLLQFY